MSRNPNFIDKTRVAVHNIRKMNSSHIQPLYQPNNSNGTVNETITVLTGEVFEISLSENRTTGYKWEVTLSSGLILINETYQLDCDPKLVGCGGQNVWSLKVTSPGSYSFKGLYKRPWEKTAIQTYNIIIVAT